ncbi:MAG: DUF4293 family protein [Tenuifilaceae bacterium]
MIQRIQSVYLLAVVILISMFFFFPFASFLLEQDMSTFHISIKGLIPNAGEQRVLLKVLPLVVLISLIILLTLVTIFLYKKRMLQIRLSILIILFLLGLQGLLYYYISVSSNMLGSTTKYSVIFVFPVISAILTYLAIRGIAKDEALIRSLDRLR